jgi:acetylglutamate/LysW-gamma-L-alpha-aminoadipate kinase
MKKKILAARDALNLGVKEAIIASILREKPITSALEHIDCTVISLE